MCLLFLYLNPEGKDDEYRLILANVRDEIYTRPTQLAQFWPENSFVIGGKDMEPGKKGGSWLVMNKNGKIGILLNILQPEDEILPNKKGRGFLAVDFVQGQLDGPTYLQQISTEAENYNGFLLVTLELRLKWKMGTISYFSNMSDDSVLCERGFHAFGNSSPLKPWQKVVAGEKKFKEVVDQHPTVNTKKELVAGLFALLRDDTEYACDEQIKQQGKGKSDNFLNKISSIFVKVPEADYGSRCHTVILVDGKGDVEYIENSREETSNEDAKWIQQQHSFQLVQ